MWVDHRGSLSIVYSDGEISTCGQISKPCQQHIFEGISTFTHGQCITHCQQKSLLKVFQVNYKSLHPLKFCSHVIVKLATKGVP